jgi:hypothetical protein
MFGHLANNLRVNSSVAAPASKWVYLKNGLLSFSKAVSILLISLIFVGCGTYTVTFLDDNDGVVATLNTTDNSATIKVPAAPAKAGYKFTLWQEVGGSATIAASAIEYAPIKDITFKAQYISNTDIVHTAIFLDDNNKKIATLQATQSSSITTPTAPAKAYYTFKGWQEVGKSETIAAAVSYALTKNIIFKAKHELNAGLYKISFYDADLEFLGSDIIASGNGIDLGAKAFSLHIANWYRARELTPTSGIITPSNSINFYAAPNIIEIGDQAWLNSIRNNLSGKYILTNDIVLDSTGAGFGAKGWQSIGDYEDPFAPFTGIFNGNGYVIGNLWIDKPYIDYAGLFGYTENATIKNLGVIIGSNGIKGHWNVGGIAGQTRDTTITNVYSTGSISGGDRVGGIAGGVSGGPITNAYSTGSISGGDYVGGIVGYVSGSPITNVYSTGSISGGDRVGGIAGHLYATITNVYSTGSINGKDYVGGIAGAVDHGGITNSYSSGNIAGFFEVGGIAGRVERYIRYTYEIIRHDRNITLANNAAINEEIQGASDVNRVIGYIEADLETIKNNFARSDMKGSFTSFIRTTNTGIGKADSQFKSQSTYSNALGWKFGNSDANPWKIDANKNGGYPYLYWEE